MENQTLSLERDLETTTSVLDLQDGPTILAGHSYGGTVITEAGRHERVAGLVYITAFAPDRGESVSTLMANPPWGAPVSPSLPPMDLFLFPDRENFGESFGADLPAADAAFMADSQVPWGVEALNGAVRVRAWRSKPDQGPALELPPNGETSRSQPVSGIPSGAWRAGVTCASTTRVRAMQASQPGT